MGVFKAPAGSGFKRTATLSVVADTLSVLRELYIVQDIVPHFLGYFFRGFAGDVIVAGVLSTDAGEKKTILLVELNLYHSCKCLAFNELRAGLQHKEVGSELLLLVLAVFLTELVIHTHRDSVLGAINLLGNEVKVNGGGGTKINFSYKTCFHIFFFLGLHYTISNYRAK